MRLTNIHVTEFQSIRDSNPVEIGDITCLVGKNEAGKTTILQAIYRLNPIIKSDGRFDVTDDYPRSDVEDYRHDVESGKRKDATVISATFRLDESELSAIFAEFGKKSLKKDEFTLKKGYENTLEYVIDTDLDEAVKFLVAKADISSQLSTSLKKTDDLQKIVELLSKAESTEEVSRLLEIFNAFQQDGFAKYVFDRFIASHLPKFVYFDEYYQMTGHENIQALQQRVADSKLKRSDHPLLGLIDMARLDFAELLNPGRTQSLVNKLEGAGNRLGRMILKYWSQNKHLQTKFDVREAQPGDPEGMQTGTNIWASVYDSRHMVTTNLGTRSRGFVWFFSFLAWYSKLQKEDEEVILLLDEPGLFLHAKAQEDLLKYFEAELKPNHQLIYTTHSPFMVDPKRFDRIRIVQDRGIDLDSDLPPEEDGTKVLTDVLEASDDSLFPLQGALGYEIHQTLFVGPNSLVVEGVSDLLYLQTMSALLQKKGHPGLRQEWTITPVGGADKVPTFVALLGAQSDLNIATLIDIQNSDRQKIENLYKKKLLEKKNVLTFADFTGQKEADIEDMFTREFYLDLVNGEYKQDLKKALKISDLKKGGPRIVSELESYFEEHPLESGMKFNHYRPARYLTENIKTMEADISDEVLGRFSSAFEALNALL